MPDCVKPLPPVDLTEARRNYTAKTDLDEAKRNYEYDMRRYLRYSSALDISPDPVALAAFLTNAYHSIEKGLAMEDTRPGFGRDKIRPIVAAIVELERLGEARFASEGGRGCIQSYVRYHDDRGWPLPDEFADELRAFAAGMEGKTFPGGATPWTRKDIEEATNFDYARFIQTRSSVRHYTGEPVDPEVVENAVRLAIKSPKVCNREMRRVRVAYEPELRNYLLSYHNGNRGFGHKMGVVMVVSVDLREFDIIGERNQGWIDGGLFAMSLVYALHAAGLGTCMLNWSEDCDRDMQLREAFEIPDYEDVITFIGAGHLPEKFEVAASPPPEVDRVLSLISRR
jgi:nitroreductase